MGYPCHFANPLVGNLLITLTVWCQRTKRSFLLYSNLILIIRLRGLTFKCLIRISFWIFVFSNELGKQFNHVAMKPHGILMKKGLLCVRNELTIKELQTRNEIVEAYPIMRQLRTHLDEDTYLELVCEAQRKIVTNCLCTK